VQLAVKGQLEAFSELVDRHQKTLMNFLMSMGVIPHELDDVSQEVWMKIYDYRQRYQEQAKFTTFMYMVAKHKVIDGHRKKKRWQNVLQLFRLERAHIGEQHERSQVSRYETQQSDPEHLLSNLSEKFREVVVLKHKEGLSLQAISELLDVPLGTVKSRLHKAMLQLKEIT
jgi:RNA polymerase sigma-70 factor (ECF subfamily)